ncbi:Alpha-L-rhamnosidase N-terminal domain-containing protein [Butyrivibrio sp. INlla16]|nr:Alpha-L-rhamnosidase N-terminal domain-containing protein [Butyrivibrio sp. INlla16]
MLADGWYRGSVGAWGIKNFYGNETRLLVQIEVYFSDGSKKVICSGENFEWTNDGPIRFADNKDGEIYDASKEDFSKAVWGKTKITKHNVIPTADISL